MSLVSQLQMATPVPISAFQGPEEEVERIGCRCYITIAIVAVLVVVGIVAASYFGTDTSRPPVQGTVLY
ncbi:hypothetical protein PRIPAC_73236 [Pristionchus pacificus]|uniref:Uncharacterized protein n=1 Tax=Pristionchus pacificus TaxID=54126 RepID=A0A2A6C7Q6_PRIPA|nr:hypothetical protein PRIPAC_73236 [Pristionchus pacificus]|eukprot:PDM74083.1 hypothetical protein PRIPAC_41439 [Pristionchus pacificus]